MNKILLIATLILVSIFSYSQGNEKENKRLANSYLSQAKKHASASNKYVHTMRNEYGLIINPSYTDRVRVDLAKYIEETQQAALCFNRALLIDPNNQAAKKLSVEFNMKVASQMFKLGEDSYGTEQDVYFNRALEYFANAYNSGADSVSVFNYVYQIDSIENNRNDGTRNFYEYVSISDEDLHKVSTASQQKNIQQIDSLNKVISENKDTDDKQKLFNLYAQLLESEKHHYKDGEFQYKAYNKAFESKVDLAIELGRTDTIDYQDVYKKYRDPYLGDYVAKQRLISQIPRSNIKVYDCIGSISTHAKEPEILFVLNENGDLCSLNRHSDKPTICKQLRDTILADGTLSHIYTARPGSYRTTPVSWCYVQFLDGVDMLLPVSNHSVEFTYPSRLQPGLHNFVDKLFIETSDDGKNMVWENHSLQTPPAPEPSFEQRTTQDIDYIVKSNKSQADRIAELEREVYELSRSINWLTTGSYYNTNSSSNSSVDGLKDEIDKLRREISDLRYELQRK